MRSARPALSCPGWNDCRAPLGRATLAVVEPESSAIPDRTLRTHNRELVSARRWQPSSVVAQIIGRGLDSRVPKRLVAAGLPHDLSLQGSHEGEQCGLEVSSFGQSGASYFLCSCTICFPPR